jgi:hypothetical protein
MRVASLLGCLLVLSGWSAAQDTDFAEGPQYLMTNNFSPLFVHSISTPSLSLNSPPDAQTSAPVLVHTTDEITYTTPPELQNQADLFPIYYGVPRVSVVEISFSEEQFARPALPESFFNSGVVEFTTPQALRERGYGVTLADAAHHWKTHKLSAPRVYTNEDIERLHGE